MKLLLLGLTAMAFLIHATPSQAAAIGDLNEVPQAENCRQKVEHRLQEYGLNYAQLKSSDWDVLFWGRKEERQVANIMFEGRPEQCSEGTIVIELHNDRACSIDDVYTTNGCSLEGVRSAWY